MVLYHLSLLFTLKNSSQKVTKSRPEKGTKTFLAAVEEDLQHSSVCQSHHFTCRFLTIQRKMTPKKTGCLSLQQHSRSFCHIQLLIKLKIRIKASMPKSEIGTNAVVERQSSKWVLSNFSFSAKIQTEIIQFNPQCARKLKER